MATSVNRFLTEFAYLDMRQRLLSAIPHTISIVYVLTTFFFPRNHCRFELAQPAQATLQASWEIRDRSAAGTPLQALDLGSGASANSAGLLNELATNFSDGAKSQP
jgi:hypothetical protein